MLNSSPATRTAALESKFTALDLKAITTDGAFEGYAILAGPTIIHAIEGTPVSEVLLTAWWRRRIAGAFSFPGVTG